MQTISKFLLLQEVLDSNRALYLVVFKIKRILSAVFRWGVRILRALTAIVDHDFAILAIMIVEASHFVYDRWWERRG
jgi:hypothetical protein